MKTSVYIPDELGNAAKEAKIEFSAALQEKLSDELRKRELGAKNFARMAYAAIRLRLQSHAGRLEKAAADGRRWAEIGATLEDLRALAEIRVIGEETDHQPDTWLYDKITIPGEETDGSFNGELNLNMFPSLRKWLLERQPEGTEGFIKTDDNGNAWWEASEFMAGFIDGATRTWKVLGELITEDEATLKRLIGDAGFDPDEATMNAALANLITDSGIPWAGRSHAKEASATATTGNNPEDATAAEVDDPPEPTT